MRVLVERVPRAQPLGAGMNQPGVGQLQFPGRRPRSRGDEPFWLGFCRERKGSHPAGAGAQAAMMDVSTISSMHCRTGREYVLQEALEQLSARARQRNGTPRDGERGIPGEGPGGRARTQGYNPRPGGPNRIHRRPPRPAGMGDAMPHSGQMRCQATRRTHKGGNQPDRANRKAGGATPQTGRPGNLSPTSPPNTRICR